MLAVWICPYNSSANSTSNVLQAVRLRYHVLPNKHSSVESQSPRRKEQPSAPIREMPARAVDGWCNFCFTRPSIYRDRGMFLRVS